MGRQEERTQVKTDSVHGFILQRQIPFSVFGVGFFKLFFQTLFCHSVTHLTLVQLRHSKKKEYVLPIH